MKRLKIYLILVGCIIAIACAHAQNKVLECGNMSVFAPQQWTSEVNDNENTLGQKSIMIQNGEERLYIIIQMAMDATPEYIMTTGVINNNAFRASSSFGKVEKIRYQSYDACIVSFSLQNGADVMRGKAVTFSKDARSYAIIAITREEVSIEDDIVFKTFRLTGKEKEFASTKSTREQLEDLINDFQSNFGDQISPGVCFDNLELDPKKNDLTFTYRMSVVSKEELNPDELQSLQKEIGQGMIDILDQMAATFKVIKQCKEENYTFRIRCLDMYKKELLYFVLTPSDYKK